MSLDKDKLTKILKLSTSNFDGEALACLRKANTMIKAAGMDWEGVLSIGGSRGNDSERRLLAKRCAELENLAIQLREDNKRLLDERRALKMALIDAKRKKHPEADTKQAPPRPSQPRRDNLDPFANSPYRGRR